MTLQKHYYTFSLVSKEDNSYMGWNSEVASTKEQAIAQAQARLDDPDSDYKVDETSFKQQTDEEMVKMMWYTS